MQLAAKITKIAFRADRERNAAIAQRRASTARDRARRSFDVSGQG